MRAQNPVSSHMQLSRAKFGREPEKATKLINNLIGSDSVRAIVLTEDLIVGRSNITSNRDFAVRFCSEDWFTFSFGVGGWFQSCLDGTNYICGPNHLGIVVSGCSELRQVRKNVHLRNITLSGSRTALTELCGFSTQDFDDMAATLNCAVGYALCGDLQLQNTLRRYAIRMSTNLQGKEHHFRDVLKRKAAAADFLLYFFEALVKAPYAPNINQTNAKDSIDQRLDQAAAYLVCSNNCGKPIDSIATLHGFSRSSFDQKFRLRFGQTPGEYRLLHRLRLATTHLKNSDLAVTTISSDLGFSSSSNFARSFSKQYGMSPSIYRQTLAEQH